MSFFSDAGSRGCVLGHALLIEEYEDCNAGAHTAAIAWSASRSLIPHSAMHPWFRSDAGHFYGNLIVGWLGWLRSAEVRDFARFLYESCEHSGYFSHRWGDQPVWPKLLGMFFDVPSLRNDKRICDWTYVRKQHFFDHQEKEGQSDRQKAAQQSGSTY